MKPTGHVRPLDHIGRVVIPIEWRRMFGIMSRDPIEIYAEGEYIVMQKYNQVCVLCGFPGDLVKFRGKLVCRACREEVGYLHYGECCHTNSGWLER
ncbi:AbrB family transcriptional regulator [Alicyclobacillus contaminans]|uniref:AbrB/MazE/SpoVT family DNA-binding domain-containing protein n=1 Tax=Alicyclobacillus contaminans TaxID=392016 RepID=UPI0006875FA2|nr:AbrB/MazE/SpoVT family DNA-binding domain-containing protein [Alicyclobacillus contaminans]GMA49295.1 AbrB family transcriptional regulator [Alicyclobacillus contaminans]